MVPGLTTHQEGEVLYEEDPEEEPADDDPEDRAETPNVSEALTAGVITPLLGSKSLLS